MHVDFFCDLLLAWRMVKIDSGLPSLPISWIYMVIVGLFPYCVFGWFSCFLILGWVTSPRALVGQILWRPIKVMGWVTSLGALVGKHSWALDGWDRGWCDDGLVISGCEVESLFDGLRWMASWSPGWVLIDVFYDIPHSCLEYGTGVNDWREIWLIHYMVRWNIEVPSQVWILHH